MIAFGCAITDVDTYESCAAAGINLAAEPSSEIMAFPSAGSIFRNYNVLLDKVKDRDDLEALVLLHQDSEIVDADFCAKVRRGLGDPDVAIVGCAGAVAVRSIAWWEGSVAWANFTHRHEDEGGGDVPALTWDPEFIPSFAKPGEVETVDGFVMALSPWAVRNLRFDETLGQLHGYDLDICLQARAAEKKIVTEDFRVIHHHSLDMIRGVDGWVEAHIKVNEKWDGKIAGLDIGGGGGDWKERARRAEAELAAQRMVGFAAEHVWSARVIAREREIDSTKGSASWRLTAPLRRLGTRLRGRPPEPGGYRDGAGSF